MARASVGHLNADDAVPGQVKQRQTEITSGVTAVGDGVGRQLARDDGDGP